MALKNMWGNSRLGRSVLVAWLVCSAMVIFLLVNLDSIVHDQLYEFGLQFSSDWANPYWLALRLTYVCLAVPSILTAAALGLDFWKVFSDKKQVPVRRPSREPVGKPEPVRKPALRVQDSRGNSTPILCPSCKKTFGKPLVILDFSTGKAKLANTCPYCNKILGDTNGNEDKKDFETRVLSPDEVTSAERRRRS